MPIQVVGSVVLVGNPDTKIRTGRALWWRRWRR